MKSSLPYAIHPIAEVLKDIAHPSEHENPNPWLPIGNFLHDWWCYALQNRHELTEEPPAPLDVQREPRWAAFCAAIVEELCVRTSFPCPRWTKQEEYFLAEPWVLTTGAADDPHGLQPFQRRNIFVGRNVLDNKYELKDRFPNASKFTPWSEEDIQQRIVDLDEEA